MKKENIRKEFTVYVMREDIGYNITLCGLCGNSGIIDTRESAIWNGKKIGMIGHCICANGRAYKNGHFEMTKEEMIKKLEHQKQIKFKNSQ